MKIIYGCNVNSLFNTNMFFNIWAKYSAHNIESILLHSKV